MFERLVASGWQGGGLGRGTVLAIVVHAAALGVALRPRQTVAATPLPVLAESIWTVLQNPEQAPGHPLPSAPTIGPGPVVPDFPLPDVRTFLPGTPAYPIPGTWTAPTIPSGDPGGRYVTATVDEAPELLSAPPPVYPELLRQAGVEGTVLVEAVVDTTGRVEARSLTVVSSPNPGFDRGAEECVRQALFRPARVEGRAVRVLVRLPVRFQLGHP